jgi:hypothetical protein
MGWSANLSQESSIVLDLTVPTQNTANNAIVKDVVGNKTDTWQGNSLYALSLNVYKHLFANSKIYPEFAAPISVTKGSGVWAAMPATKTEVVPVNTITNPFNHIKRKCGGGCDSNKS